MQAKFIYTLNGINSTFSLVIAMTVTSTWAKDDLSHFLNSQLCYKGTHRGAFCERFQYVAW